MATDDKWTEIGKMEHGLVMQIGRKIGFGRILQLVPECWAEYLEPGGMAKDAAIGPGRVHASSARDKCGPQMVAELTRLRQQLSGLAEHFDEQAKLAYGDAFADGINYANTQAAAQVRGIVGSTGGADGEG